MVENLKRCFLNISNPDAKVRLPSEKIISEFMESNPREFLSISSSLLLEDDVDYVILRAALTFIVKILTPSTRITLSEIKEMLYIDSFIEEREKIKSAVVRGIMFNDQVIRQQSARCVDLLLQM